MGLIRKLKESSTREVQAGGIRWRIKAIRGEDCLAAGFAMLPIIPVEQEEKAGDPDKQRKALEAKLAKGDVGGLLRMKEHTAAVVCAGVTHGYDPEEGEWEPVTLIAEGDSDPEAGTLSLVDLPMGVEEELFGAILKLTTDGGRAQERLKPFRHEGGEADPADA